MFLDSKYIDWIDNGKIKLVKEKHFLIHDLVADCDVLKITHIVFDNDPKGMGIGDEIIIKTSNNILYKCSFNLLALLNPVIKIDNGYVLAVDFFDIFLIASTFSSFLIEIDINNLEFKKITFLTQKIFIKQNFRDRFSSYEHIIKSPLSNYKIINSNQVNFIICSHERIDGYYIESNINNKVHIYKYVR